MKKVESSIKNSICAMASNITAILIGIIAQIFFIKILGIEYLGLNGLFTNIISMLGIIELGMGSAIIYNLYRPMATGDSKTINSLMRFYKKAYNIITIIVLIIGLSITPFIDFFIEKITIDINIYLVYVLFILDVVCSYILSYKRSILYADQRNYVINLVHMGYLVILNVFQLLFLMITKNYYIYLIVKIVMRLLENIVITVIVNANYKYLNVKNADPLDKEIENDIFTKIKALFFHKMGTFIVTGTDNIIISKFLGLAIVGLYYNYYLIINAVNVLFGQAITAITPSVGHLLIEDNKEKNYNTFKKLRFINFWISTFTGTAILVIMQTFIQAWLGKQYLLPEIVLFVLVINFYQKMMRSSYITFKEAAGIYYEDRFVPIIESLLNIIISVVFVQIIGLAGVFIGTIVSGLLLWAFSYPKFVYKKLFERSYLNYAKETIGYILLFVGISFFTYLISMQITVSNIFVQLVMQAVIGLIIPNLIIILLFFRTENFKYLLELKNNFKQKIRKSSK